MFGFSLPKIMVLLFIIFLVWQVFKLIEKRNKLKEQSNDNEKGQKGLYESLIECKVCGNFFSMDVSKNCPICEKKNT